MNLSVNNNYKCGISNHTNSRKNPVSFKGGVHESVEQFLKQQLISTCKDGSIGCNSAEIKQLEKDTFKALDTLKEKAKNMHKDTVFCVRKRPSNSFYTLEADNEKLGSKVICARFGSDLFYMPPNKRLEEFIDESNIIYPKGVEEELYEKSFNFLTHIIEKSKYSDKNYAVKNINNIKCKLNDIKEYEEGWSGYDAYCRRKESSGDEKRGKIENELQKLADEKKEKDEIIKRNCSEKNTKKGFFDWLISSYENYKDNRQWSMKRFMEKFDIWQGVDPYHTYG